MWILVQHHTIDDHEVMLCPKYDCDELYHRDQLPFAKTVVQFIQLVVSYLKS